MAKGFNDLNDVAKEYGIGGNKSGWYEAQEGENRIRVVSGFEVLAKYWANGKMLGIASSKVPPPMTTDKETGEQVPMKPSVKFLMYVIDRKDITDDHKNGKVKVGEFGWSIVEAMQKLSQNAEYGFEGLPPYDMILTKTVKNGGKNISDTSYQVLPARANSTLTDEELREVASLTPIEEVVRRIKAKAGGEGGEGDEDAAAEAAAERLDMPSSVYDVGEINPEDLP